MNGQSVGGGGLITGIIFKLAGRQANGGLKGGRGGGLLTGIFSMIQFKT